MASGFLQRLFHSVGSIIHTTHVFTNTLISLISRVASGWGFYMFLENSVYHEDVHVGSELLIVSPSDLPSGAARLCLGHHCSPHAPYHGLPVRPWLL